MRRRSTKCCAWWRIMKTLSLRVARVLLLVAHEQLEAPNRGYVDPANPGYSREGSKKKLLQLCCASWGAKKWRTYCAGGKDTKWPPKSTGKKLPALKAKSKSRKTSKKKKPKTGPAPKAKWPRQFFMFFRSASWSMISRVCASWTIFIKSQEGKNNPGIAPNGYNNKGADLAPLVLTR